MQITGQQLHEAFLYVSGEGRSWEHCSDALHDRYNAMAQRLMVLVEQQASIERLRAAGLLEEQQEVQS